MIKPGHSHPENAENLINPPNTYLPRHENDEEYTWHLATIVELCEDAIISQTLNGTIKSWNKSSEKMFGYTAEEIVGKQISLIIPQAYINEEKNVIERICNTEIIDHYRTIRRKKNGEELYVSLTVSPLKDRSGRIIGVSKIARDVTLLKKTEADLIDFNQELVFKNKEKEKRIAELVMANEELAFQNEEKEKRAAELIIANRELVFQHQEKEKRAAELVIANDELIFQNEEKEKRVAELVIANKELKKAEDDIRKLNEELEQKVIRRTRELESANKELESFSYSVSHDLRAPLRAVHGYARILNEDFGAHFNPEASRVMGNIINNSKKMGQLIDDLLTFSHLGRKELVKMNIPMHEMATNLCEEIKHEQNNRSIQFKIDELKPAQGDIAAIKQVWVNLISNAVKYSKLNENAIIEISSEEKGNEIIYFIKDNGAGFDMRYANKLFGVFQRLHSDEKFEGTGVGLAIVHRIITKHGGRVWAESKVDKGAIFYFSLPKHGS